MAAGKEIIVDVESRLPFIFGSCMYRLGKVQVGPDSVSSGCQQTSELGEGRVAGQRGCEQWRKADSPTGEKDSN